MTATAAQRAALAGLHVLADDAPMWPHDPVEQARAACAGGANVVQLRAKRTSDAETLRMAQAIRDVTSRAGALFILNDRFDLALAAGADGVHLGQKDVAPERIPASMRERLLLGRSTHNEAQWQAAANECIDYVAFGPVFETTSKASEWPARGVAALARAVEAASPRPLVAIGGIGPENIAQIGEIGAGAAVISAIAGSEAMQVATRTLVRTFDAARGNAR